MGGAVWIATGLSVTPGAFGFGISTGVSACDTKMFLPDPSYLVSSLAARSCNCRVGSRFSLSEIVFLCPEVLVDRVGRRGAALVREETGADAAKGWEFAVTVGEDPENTGKSSNTNTIMASAPKAAAAIVFFLFSVPNFTVESPSGKSQAPSLTSPVPAGLRPIQCR